MRMENRTTAIVTIVGDEPKNLGDDGVTALHDHSPAVTLCYYRIDPELEMP